MRRSYIEVNISMSWTETSITKQETTKSELFSSLISQFIIAIAKDLKFFEDYNIFKDFQKANGFRLLCGSFICEVVKELSLEELLMPGMYLNLNVDWNCSVFVYKSHVLSFHFCGYLHKATDIMIWIFVIFLLHNVYYYEAKRCCFLCINIFFSSFTFLCLFTFLILSPV